MKLAVGLYLYLNRGDEMENDIAIEEYSAPDKNAIIDLLGHAKLPIEDLTEEKLDHFMIAKGQDDSLLGVVGVEFYKDMGLLRSLVVHPLYRNKGLGRRLVRQMESVARQKGIITLYLLTMTAPDYFSRLGYKRTERNAAPSCIRETAEFKSMCPASAVCLSKVL
jgi:amino-acid N-acetyltransferase